MGVEVVRVVAERGWHIPQLQSREELHFALSDEGLPGHVRSGSGMRRWAGQVVVLSDDVHALALVDEVSGRVTPLLLPPGADGERVFSARQGNKRLKMDLEACVVLPDGRFVAFGSGSTEERRRIVILDEQLNVRVFDGSALYEHLRASEVFSGSELNIEGAVVHDGALKLFQRGNGAAVGELLPVSAVGELELSAFVGWLDGGPVPELRKVMVVDLGDIAGVPLGFTDACVLPDGRLAFIAGAEQCPNAYDDGELLGGCFGVMDGERVSTTRVIREDGSACLLKLEGLEYLGEDEEGCSQFMVVADMDDEYAPTVRGLMTALVGELLL